MFRTMADVRQANKELGHSWFDADTLRFFRSRVGGQLYGGRYFVSSEQYTGLAWGLYQEAPRRYTVRVVSSEGAIDTVGDFQQYRTREQAVAAARSLARSETRTVTT